MSSVHDSISALAAATDDVATDAPAAQQDCDDRIKLTFFFDGTGQDKLTDPSGEAWSNVAKLAEIARRDEGNGTYPYYISGIGTNLIREEPWWKLGQYFRDTTLLGGSTGWGAESRLESGDIYLSKALRRALQLAARKASGEVQRVCHQNENDAFDELHSALANHRLIKAIDISVFGFSRGAALARTFVNRLLKQCERSNGELTYQSYPIRFRFVGLFDTVASFGLPASNLFDDVDLWLPEEVERCAHYVSAHELRYAFPVTLIRQNGDYPTGWKEEVFPGVHSDVGGGYAPGQQSRSNTSARVPLAAMLREATQAGVPLRGWKDVSTDALFNNMFEIPEQTQSLFDTYMASLGAGATSGPVGQRMQTHMEPWYAYKREVTGETSPDDGRYQTKADPLRARVEEIDAKIRSIFNEANTRSAGYLRTRELAEERSRVQSELDALNSGKEAIDDGQATIADEAAVLREMRQRGQPLVIGKIGVRDSHVFESRAQPWMLDAYYGPEPQPEVIKFFDTLVHDSKASFLGGNAPWSYFRNRGVAEAIEPETSGDKTDTWREGVAGYRW